MTKEEREEKIKLEELKFVKQQEHFVDQKLNIIAVISGIFISGAFAFMSTKFDLIKLNEKIWFFIFIGIGILFLFWAVSPKIFFREKKSLSNCKKNKTILEYLPAEDNLYKQEYQGWETNFKKSLDVQIKLSRQILKKKTFFCRTLIVIEFAMFLGIAILFTFCL